MAPSPEERFEEVARRYVRRATVTRGTGFGTSPGLRVGGKIFAMLAGGELVVKLPKDRVDELVGSGGASRFDTGAGRVMKEWASVPTRKGRTWDALVDEAFAFVGSGGRTARTQ